ncbi:MAG TPA: transglutaminase domain-containing protein [Ktedonobacteraceae bacterium]
MRSSLIDARPATGAQGYPARSTPQPQRPPLPPPVTPSRKRKRISLVPAEGWLPLLLLAVAVYSVVYSVTAAIPTGHTDVLWMTTALGLVCGLIVSKSRFFPQAVLHVAACILGYWLALFLTSLAYHISLLEMLASFRMVISNGFSIAGMPQSDTVFLFYLAFLCFFLGYFGSWLIYRAHLPWLVALVYVSIMIVNLNYIAKRDLTFLVVVLAASLIPLVARVQLAGQLAQWKNEGLYTDQVWLRNLTGRFLRVVCLFALLILPLSWFLPVVNQPTSGVTLWNNLDNAWANLSHGNLASLTNPNMLFSPYQPSANFFGDQLTITGNVNLPDGPVLTYTSPSSTKGQYLEGFSYDLFDGHTWTSSMQSTQNFSSNNQLPPSYSGAAGASQLDTSITVLQPPGGTKNFIFAPADPSQFTVPVTIYTDSTNNFIAAWAQTTPLSQNEHYRVTSMISTASAVDLAHIALPDNDPSLWTTNLSYSELKQYYLQVPRTLSPEVLATAKTWTQGASTVYDVASALQAHLSNQKEFTYSVSNPPVPTNIDAVTWLLHQHKGYCTYYATAMVMMARLLGVPARVINGFSQGHFDTSRKAWVVNGSDAHSWVQIYFPNFGWMNFDPTPSFSINNAGSPAPQPTAGPTKTPATPKSTTTPRVHITPGAQVTPTPPPSNPAGKPSTAGNTLDGSNLFLTIALLVLLSSCVVLGFAVLRYQRARRAAQTTISTLYARLCLIARMVGSPPAAWQTPYEYTFTLSRRFPQASATLRRLADLFVRERWATPQQAPNPAEQRELTRLWPNLRNTILRSPFSKDR